MICNTCKIDKEISEFSTTRAGYKKYTAKMCKSCNKDRVRKYRQNNEYTSNERKIARNRKFLNIEKYLFNIAKKRAKYSNTEFNISESDIIIPKYCPILNIELKVNNDVAKNNSLSLDRINNNKGYIKGNIAVISRLANAMKSSCSYEELITFSKNIKTYLDQYKQGELLENPTVDNRDNQQPSLDSNILEGSTTNIQILNFNKDGNDNKSALPLEIDSNGFVTTILSDGNKVIWKPIKGIDY